MERAKILSQEEVNLVSSFLNRSKRIAQKAQYNTNTETHLEASWPFQNDAAVIADTAAAVGISHGPKRNNSINRDFILLLLIE